MGNWVINKYIIVVILEFYASRAQGVECSYNIRAMSIMDKAQNT